MPALTVHNAEIKTAAVEIRTLTISGKQVTLAVFRQLREEPLVAEDGTLNGVPWGTVNYHPVAKQCDDVGDHWHVVWQQGSDLLRSTVTKSIRWSRRTFFPDNGPDLLAAHVRDVLSGAGSRFWRGEIPKFETGRYRLTDADLSLVEKGLPVGVDLTEAITSALDQDRLVARYDDDETESWSTNGSVAWEDGRYIRVSRSAARRASRHLFDTALAALTAEPAESLHRMFMAEVDNEIERRRRHDEIRRAIADLPQLFIAV